MNRIYYPYSEFLIDIQTLVQKIDQKCDAILAISRGGLTLAHFLGEHYKIREVYAINTIGYEDTQKLESLKVFNIPDLTATKTVLIVDDIVDSGDTLIAVLEVLQGRFPDTVFLSSSIFYKSTAKIKPTWFVKEAKEWIDFFWSVDIKAE